MGIIAKQSIKGSIYTYAGVIFGFIGTGILMPKFFSTEQVGLVNMLISTTLLFSQFATLGFASVNTRIFPFFRNNENGHNGLLSLGLIVTLVGFTVSSAVFLVFKTSILSGSSGKSDLILQYSAYFFPLFFFTVYFLFFDSYAKSMFDSIIGTFLRDFLVKLLNLAIVVAYVFDFLDFNSFVFAYVGIYILPTLIIIAVLIQRKQFKIMPFNKILMTQYRLEILKVSLFGIMAGFSGVAVVNIDTIMTNYYLGLSISGIYAINFFLGNLVLLPSRSLRKISSIVISEAWKKNEIALISDIYYKSTINQLIIGIFLFGGIFINLDNLYIVIPEYALGKQALIILLVGFLLEMISGLSPIIMTTSVYYKYFALQILASFFVLILLCIIFIPIWGINGTAIAVSINLVIFILIRFYFLYKRFGFQPYNKSHLIIAAFGILALIASYAIPKFEHFAIDFFLRSTVFSLIFLIPVILSKISDNLNDVVNKIIFRLKKLAQKT